MILRYRIACFGRRVRRACPHLYDVTVELYRGKELCDTKNTELGVRTVRLLMTECAGDDGEFCFEINGKKTFLLGTNWVPLDAFPSRFEERLRRH